MRSFAGVLELVDETDSKSVVSDGVWVRVPPPAPRRSGLYIVRSDFFQKSELIHSVVPPCQPRPACAGCASDKKTGSDLDCSTAPKRKTRLWEELRKEVPPKTFVKSAECNRIAGNFNISEDYIMDKTIFEQMGGTYHQEGDYFLPDLPPPESIPVGVWGQRRRQYLKTQRRVIYTGLLLSGKLDGHLAEIDAQAEAMLFQLVNQLAEQEGITEQLKAENQMEWVQRMNNIRNRVEEIIYNDLIYI